MPAKTQTTRSIAPRGQLIDDLDREWTDLVRSAGFVADTESWLDRWPALRPYFRTDARPASARLDRTQADEILGALLAEHSAGSYPAGRMVLQCMLGAAVTIARRCQGRFPTYDDAIAETVTALWTAIATYEADRTDRVAGRLHFAVLEAVAGRRTIKVADHEVPLPFDVLDAHALMLESAGPALDGTHQLGVTGEVLEVIAWGIDAGALTADDAALITRLYVADDTGSTPDGATLAAELGVSHPALRQRAHRAVRRLAQAVIDDNAGAQW
jgi:hypothetical protein